jgi:xanthine dehydrogenase YagS FAD-binding subunit
MLSNFGYVRPVTLKDAVARSASPGAHVFAGGTDLLGCLRDDVFSAQELVSLGALDELRGIRPAPDGGVRIGALTTIAEVAAHPLVKERFAGLSQAAGAVASPQLRNQGTIGGNLCQKPRCWYYRGEFHCLRKGGEMCYAFDGENQFHCIFGGDRCYIVHPSDTAPMLVALDALVRTQGPAGSRAIPVAKLHVPPSVDPERETVLEPGEILTEVVIPAPSRGLKSSYRKVRARRSWDFALAGVALAVAFDGDVVREARVVLSGAAPVPWRSPAVERVITGQQLNADVAERAGEAAVKGAEPLAKNGYKLPLFRGTVRESLLALA